MCRHRAPSTSWSTSLCLTQGRLRTHTRRNLVQSQRQAQRPSAYERLEQANTVSPRRCSCCSRRSIGAEGRRSIDRQDVHDPLARSLPVNQPSSAPRFTKVHATPAHVRVAAAAWSAGATKPPSRGGHSTLARQKIERADFCGAPSTRCSLWSPALRFSVVVLATMANDHCNCSPASSSARCRSGPKHRNAGLTLLNSPVSVKLGHSAAREKEPERTQLGDRRRLDQAHRDRVQWSECMRWTLVQDKRWHFRSDVLQQADPVRLREDCHSTKQLVSRWSPRVIRPTFACLTRQHFMHIGDVSLHIRVREHDLDLEQPTARLQVKPKRASERLDSAALSEQARMFALQTVVTHAPTSRIGIDDSSAVQRSLSDAMLT